MGKHGPCYHCGVTSTPLWRNGPPEKPVLCNACGSRWRTKGSLINYTPMHSRPEGDDLIIPKVSKIKTNYAHKNKEAKLLKRKQNHENDENGVRGIHYRKIKDEQSSTISSSGSVISNSESYTQFRVVDASEDLSQSVVWDTFVTPQKKTCVSHSNQSSSVQKLTKDLYAILHEQQSSYAPESPENDLLIESEIVNGTVKHPSPLILEEESEASSITIENKLVLLANDEFSREMPQKQIKMDKSQVENVQILESCNSRLRNVDLKDVVNFEEFMRNMTMNEQRELVKFLPLADITKYPENLKGMFDSNQFKESLISFQHLLGEGVFDKSLVGSKDEDCEALKKLALFDLSKSQWIECYNLLKRCENSSTTRDMERGLNVMNSSTFVDMKRPSDGQYQNISEISTTMVTPKLANMYTNDGSKEATYNSNSLIPDSFHYSYETFDEDLLLDVPFSHSFPQAELLSQT